MAPLASALAMTPLLFSGALALPQLVVPHVEEDFMNITLTTTTTVYTDSATDNCVAPTATEYTDSATGECDSPVTTTTVTVTPSTSTSENWETDEPVQTTEPTSDDAEEEEEDSVCETVDADTTSTSTSSDSETIKPVSFAEPPFDAEDPAAKTVNPTTSTPTSTVQETNKPVQPTEPPFDAEDPANPFKGMSTVPAPSGNPGIPTYYIGPQTITVHPEGPTTTSRWYYTAPAGEPAMAGLPPGFGGGPPDLGRFGNGHRGGFGKVRRSEAAPTTTMEASASASASWDFHYGVPPVVASTEAAPVTSRRPMVTAEDSSKTALPTTMPTGILPPRPAIPAVSTMDNGDVVYGDHWSVPVGSDAAPLSEDAEDSDADEDADEDDGDDESTQEQSSTSFGTTKTLHGHIVGRPTQPEPEPEKATETGTETLTPSRTRAHQTLVAGSTLRTLRKPTTSSNTTTTAPIFTHNWLVPIDGFLQDNPLPETTTPPPPSPTPAHTQVITHNGIVYTKNTDCTAVVVRIRGALSTLKACHHTATTTITMAAGRRSAAPLPPPSEDECHHHIRNGTTHPPPPYCMKSIDRMDQ